MIRLLLLTFLFLSEGAIGTTPTALPTTPTILVLGDSLSASYGLDRELGWVSLLEERLRQRGMPYRVINASVSGETTAGGLTRLDSLLSQHQPEVLLIELGANDGLRGLAFDIMRGNLIALIRRSQAADSRILLIAVPLPPNYGEAYTVGFQAVFRDVAEAEKVAFVPDLLAGIAEDRTLMQADGLHPTAEAQPRILGNVWPVLERLLPPSAGGTQQ